MGKVDDMRAMREARYAAQSKSQTKRVAIQKEATDDLCGHRAISGKTCTRLKDHSEKNHRYT